MDIERKQYEQEKESEIEVFRKKISRLAQTEEDPHLAGIDVNDLTEEDMITFGRYENGVLNIEDVQRQEKVLAGLAETKEVQASIKLLSYLCAKLETRAWDQR